MFDFMRLPQELRELIYGHMLPRDIIKIIRGFPSKCLIRDHPQEMVNHNGFIIGKELRTSYRLAKSSASPPSLNIFRTNRKVYSEAWPIFYMNNVFDFTSAMELDPLTLTGGQSRNCINFLIDRPRYALRLISEIRLRLGGHIERPLWQSIIGVHWAQICNILGRELSLRTLVLHLDGEPPFDHGSYWPSDWTDQLGKIKGLRRFDVHLTSYCTSEEAFAFLQRLRTKVNWEGAYVATEEVVGSKHHTNGANNVRTETTVLASARLIKPAIRLPSAP